MLNYLQFIIKMAKPSGKQRNIQDLKGFTKLMLTDVATLYLS